MTGTALNVGTVDLYLAGACPTPTVDKGTICEYISISKLSHSAPVDHWWVGSCLDRKDHRVNPPVLAPMNHGGEAVGLLLQNISRCSQLLGGGKRVDSQWELWGYYLSIVYKLRKCLHLVSSDCWGSFPGTATHRDTPAFFLAKPHHLHRHTSWVGKAVTY